MHINLLLAIAFCALLTKYSVAQAPEVESIQAQQEEKDRQKEQNRRLHMEEHLAPESLRADLEQFREVLKTEWLVATLSDASFDAAITELAGRAGDGMSRSELLFELQRILALGVDGHAEMTVLAGALSSFQREQGFPDFYIEICGDDYIAYQIEHLEDGAVNPRMPWRYKLLRDGFPYVSAIDGVPIEKWMETISRFVPKGPETAVRWRCVQWIGYLPFWRHQLGLPPSNAIKVQLTSEDKSERIEIDAPVGKYPSAQHLHLPRPDWKILDNELGYVWIRNPAAGSVQLIMEAMSQFRDTKGLIVDLRGNDGGSGTETLQVMAAFLLPPDEPRRVVGSEVQWVPWSERQTDRSFSTDDTRVSAAGQKMIAEYEKRFGPRWKPPAHRAIEWRHMLMARPEAEPGIYPFHVPEFPAALFYHYSSPVVVLMDHRNFSAAELFLAGIRALDNVTLVGSPTTAAGGTGAAVFKLEKSGLEFMLGSAHSFVQTNGDFVDGNGIRPDMVVHPDVDYYVGRQDRALETGIQVLTRKAASSEKVSSGQE